MSEPPAERLDTESMTLDAFVEQVGGVLGRAHSLFGLPPESAGSAALSAGSPLAAAGHLIRDGLPQVSGLSGEFASDYATFGDTAATNLSRLADTDARLDAHLRNAAHAERSGHMSSGRVLNAAAADTAVLARYTDTPAGQRALITALRARLAHQQQVVFAYKRRDAAMASLLRSLTYSSRASGGAGISPPRGGFTMPLSGAAVSRPPVPAMAGLSRIGSSRDAENSDAELASRVDPRAGRVPSGPGGEAAAAAFSKRGTPYVWGAKGPNSFDCSGLTQWAWAHAGVRLGSDTYSQFEQGVPVAPGQVRAGDLIFPKGSWDGRGPGHVQLAISSTEVVHAPQTGDVVRIAPMPAAYVARRPVPVAQSAEN